MGRPLLRGERGAVEVSYDPRTGESRGEVPVSSTAEVRAALLGAVSAAPRLATVSPSTRRDWLEALAAALEDAADELVPLADRETGLGADRLQSELTRTAGQLRFYGAVAAEGSYLGATLDPGTATAPTLGRVNVPLGPVAVFGASNFPFAFSVLGNDTASALAAGCPVLVKAHPAHPVLSRRCGEIARTALAAAGAPDGTFALVVGLGAGNELLLADEVCALAFTGSEIIGTSLWRKAHTRERPIPVFAEMGTVNPAVLTPAGAVRHAGDLAELADGFVDSFMLGSGQFCTKPGLLLAPAGAGVPDAVAQALLRAEPPGSLLTRSIATNAERGLSDLIRSGAALVAQVRGSGQGWSADAAVLTAHASLLTHGSRLLQEVFGPVALVVEYADLAELHVALGQLSGSLAASVLPGSPDPDLDGVLSALGRKVGRLVVDGWTTGVPVGWAQHHGGPWPATTNPAHTSVGAGALDRFVRPVAFQGVPDAHLPPPLQAANPWCLPRRVGGVPQPAPGPTPTATLPTRTPIGLPLQETR